MYCDCCGKRLTEDYTSKDMEHPLCRSCKRGDCYETGHR